MTTTADTVRCEDRGPFLKTNKALLKGSPSRRRFHPPPPLTFRPPALRPSAYQPPEAASTYSRSVLGASGTLGPRLASRQAVTTADSRNVRQLRNIWPTPVPLRGALAGGSDCSLGIG